MAGLFYFYPMKIALWSVGRPHEAQMKAGIEEFTGRIGRYYPVTWVIIPVPKNAASLPEKEMKKKEGEAILEKLAKDDVLVALDEYGKMLSSEKLAGLIEEKANAGVKQLVFLIGGAFGLDEAVLKRSNFTWSLSQLTFPHQLVRLILAEQVYRACSINRNEKYHHR